MKLANKLAVLTAVAGVALASLAQAAGHTKQMVAGSDQDVSGGAVTADAVMSGANGWLVVHRVKADGKPGPVIGHAPLKKGANENVSAILTEKVASGAKLMLMLHSEEGGSKTGIFEYTLGAKADGPVKVEGKLVTAVITAQ